jgi:FtsP/CotA-like multicopper oxidase with cupredoxin domain
MRRTFLVGSTILCAMLSMPHASATRPSREVHTQDDGVILDQCAFPVLAHIDGVEVITTFTDRAGDPVKQIVTFPGNTITLTNLDSGGSITVMGTGSSQLRLQGDGSLSARAMGHGPFFPNPLTGEPGIWYLSGQGRSSIDPEGNVTSVLAGRLVNLCPRLTSA